MDEKYTEANIEIDENGIMYSEDPVTKHRDIINDNTIVEFRFDRFMCEEKNSYPEIGDVIYFDNSYYEINNTSEVQYSGGFAKNNFSVVCETFMVSKSTLNIEDRIR